MPNTPQSQQRETQAHYDDFPYAVGVHENPAYESDRTLMGRFITDIRGGRVLDIGCGPGNLLGILARRADYVCGLDLSPHTLDLAAAHVKTVGQEKVVFLTQGSALAIPFGDQQFDRVFAVGVLHHTPDAQRGFHQACRVLKSGSSAYLALYQQGSYYQVLYQTLGRIVRACENNRLSALVVNRILVLPLFLVYFMVGRWVVNRRLEFPTPSSLMNYFADQLLNPVVSFHSLAQVEAWAEAAGAEIVAHKSSHAGALLNIHIRRV